MNKKYIPLRRCMGCNERKEKDKLIRIVRNGNRIELDLSGKKDGRGAYICKNEECLNKAIKNKRLSRSLKEEISQELYEKIRGIL